MTDFTKDFLLRERHTMLGILCGVAAANAIEKKDNDDSFAIFTKLVELFAAAAIAHYAFAAKEKYSRIRFALGLAFACASHYRHLNADR